MNATKKPKKKHTSIEAMKLALVVLERIADEVSSPYKNSGEANELGEAILALRKAIDAEIEQSMIEVGQKPTEKEKRMKKQIQKAVTFIQATREEATTLANDIVGDAEVHALVIQKGFNVNPEPVGYMVVRKKEWLSLTEKEIKEISFANRPYVVDMVVALEAKLKEKNYG